MIKKLLAIYQRFSKREKWIFYGTMFVLTALFADHLVIGPVAHKMFMLDRQVKDEEAAIKKSMHVLLQKTRITSEGKEFMAYSVEAKNPEEEMTALLKEIERLADRAAVSLLYVKPASGKEESGVKKYFAGLECEAEMEAIANFFHSVESSTSLLKVEKYEIQPKNRESSIARCAVSISKTVLAAS